jgi:hypothetical protein
MSTAEEVRGRITKNLAEMRLCTRILDMWSEVMAQGIKPEDVDRFTLDPKLLTGKDAGSFRMWPERWLAGCTRNDKGQLERNPARVVPVKRYNVVILKSGERRTLNPWIQAPEHRE